MDSNGYNPSLLQEDDFHCYLCGRQDRKLDRHEIFFGTAYREKSKQDGLWVLLCHEDCHEGPHGVHHDRALREAISRTAQERAMSFYGWSLDYWRERYGKSWL